MKTLNKARTHTHTHTHTHYARLRQTLCALPTLAGSAPAPLAFATLTAGLQCLLLCTGEHLEVALHTFLFLLGPGTECLGIVELVLHFRPRRWRARVQVYHEVVDRSRGRIA
jgi:hypothetical protein